MELSRRVGLCAVIGALVLRLGCSSLPQKLVEWLADPRVGQLILFIETGRQLSTQGVTQNHEAESAEPVFKTAMTFSEEDADLVTLHSSSVKSADIPDLLTRPLSWNLFENEPTVLIIHTHTSESYLNNGAYIEDGSYRTLDEEYNMLRVGQALKEELEKAGIGVIHDRTFHDYPSYNGAYTHARESLANYLQQYPSIELVIDLHRDAISDSRGNQLSYTCDDAAQLMLVIGTNHEAWTENMALAVKLQARLQQLHPGICRPMTVRGQRFNQDLSTGAVLVEVGAAGNTLDQALASVPILSRAIIDLAQGTE